MTVEAWRAGEAYYEACVTIAFFIQLLAYTTAALLVSWRVALAAFGAGLVIMFLLKRLVKLGRQAGHSQTELSKSLISRLTDASGDRGARRTAGAHPAAAQEQRPQPSRGHGPAQEGSR